MLVDFASRSLIGKAKARPDFVLQVLDKAKREGMLNTAKAALNRLDQPMPFGYSTSGVVEDVGKGVTGFNLVTGWPVPEIMPFTLSTILFLKTFL